MGLAFWGGLAGAGRGMADVGQQMNTAANERDRQANLERIAQERNDANERMNQERVDARMAAIEAKAGGSARSGTRGGSGGSMSLKDLLQDPELLARATGTTLGQVNDVGALTRGEMPQDTTMQDNGPDGEVAVKRDRYTPGQASDMLKKASSDLYQALGLTNPGQADDLAKAERTAQGTKYAAEYRSGDEYAGQAALINDSKPAFNDGSNLATGAVVPGSLDAARIRSEGALAGERAAKTDTEKDKVSGKGSVKEDLALIDSQRKAIDVRLNNARAMYNEATKMGNDAEATAQKSMMNRLQAQYDNLDAQYTTVAGKLAARDGKGTLPTAIATKPSAADVRKAEPAAKSAVDKLPAGAVKIGTKNGKTVYQTPDGKKFIEG